MARHAPVKFSNQLQRAPVWLAAIALACGAVVQAQQQPVTTGPVPATPAPYTFIEGKVPQGVQPDGNSIVFEGPNEMLVIDTGRHPEHTDKIIGSQIYSPHWPATLVAGLFLYGWC